jgi:hypothetical protein
MNWTDGLVLGALNPVSLTRLPTLVSKALYRATADVGVVRVNDGPPSFR